MSTAFFLYKNYLKRSQVKEIFVGYPKHWGPLVPSLQCTMYGDSIITNQFESLVKIGSDQLIHPMASKSWTIDPSFKIYTFKIDTNKKFSNGKSLSAMDFKKAWEDGLKLVSVSHNHNTLEVLSYVEGFENFEKNGTISGLNAIDDGTLQITFTKPYRLALDHLTGGRFSASILVDNKYLGTGRYVINQNEDNKNEVRLSINSYHQDSQGLLPVVIKVIHPVEALSALENNAIDIYEFAFMADFNDVCDKQDSNLTCISGSESVHVALEISGSKNKFFSNKNYRKALQYLIIKNLKEIDVPRSLKSSQFRFNHQVYLPLQLGSIDPTEVQSIIAEGKNDVEQLVQASKKHPIKYYFSEDGDWIKNILTDAGITLSPDSGAMKWEYILKLRKEQGDIDLYLGGFSVANGDPDGIYHKLGKKGAILSPMTYQEKVDNLLDSGKEITTRDEIDNHYKKVSRSILEEVPFIHLGFNRSLSVFRNDKVENSEKIKERNENRLHFYKKL